MKKEKRTKEIRVTVHGSMYNELQKRCESEYRTISEVVRELLSKWLRETKNAWSKNNND